MRLSAWLARVSGRGEEVRTVGWADGSVGGTSHGASDLLAVTPHTPALAGPGVALHRRELAVVAALRAIRARVRAGPDGVTQLFAPRLGHGRLQRTVYTHTHSQRG